MAHDPSGRIKVVTATDTIGPHTCALCSTDVSQRGFAAPGLHYEYHGELYFCEYCAEEIGSALGGLTMREANSLKAEVVKWKKAYQTLDLLEKKARKENDHFRNTFSALGYHAPDVSEPSSSVEDTSQPERDTEEVSVNVSGSERDADEVEPVVAESGSDDGPNDVSNAQPSNSVLSGLSL